MECSGPGARLPEFESQLHHLPAAGCVKFCLSLSIFVYNLKHGRYSEELVRWHKWIVQSSSWHTVQSMSKSLAILTVYQELTRPSSALWTLLSNTINPIILPVTQMPFGSSSPLVLIVNLVLLLFNPSLFLLTDDAFFLYKRLRYRHITNARYREKLKVQN